MPMPTEDCSPMASRRFASRATRDLHLEQLISPLPELGLVAANGPNDPEPELVVGDGVVTRMDGRDGAGFDVNGRFVVAQRPGPGWGPPNSPSGHLGGPGGMRIAY